MTRHAWHLTDGVYRLRPEGGPPGSSVVSLWGEGLGGDCHWMWTLWQRGEVVGRGESKEAWTPTGKAKRLAVDDARRLGLIGEKDEVTT